MREVDAVEGEGEGDVVAREESADPVLARLLLACSASDGVQVTGMSRAALDGLLDPLASALDPAALRQIVGFRISAEVQARVDYLATRANEGELTPDEDAEYEALIDGADLIAVLKLKAQRLLAA